MVGMVGRNGGRRGEGNGGRKKGCMNGKEGWKKAEREGKGEGVIGDWQNEMRKR